ncbi:MAG TPA: ribose 5-phosphate isomerase B [Actinomycetota bacterium]|nr:ribose 5-phosphate isomerase B [Actinomycetota bacterium]
MSKRSRLVHYEGHMRVAVGVDHRGFLIKEDLVALLKEGGHDVVDLGTSSTESVDYPDVSKAVGEAVRNGDADRGVIVCGSGAGAVIAANKLKGIRCALAHDTYTAHQSVEHDDANVLALGSGIVGIEVIREVVKAFLGAQFLGAERYQRRLDKIQKLERDG